MDYSANFEDISDVSLFNRSNIYESTPKTDSSVLCNVSKKRKFTETKSRRKLVDSLESPSVNISNESLSHKFQNINIESSYCVSGPAFKYYKSNGCEKIETPPSTPESIIKSFDTPKKPILFQKCSSASSVPSPLKEQHGILYPDLKPLVPQRKPLTPQKLREKINKDPVLSRKIVSKEDRLIHEILTNDVIMGKIFYHISDGDLFRISMVSRCFRNSLERNFSARKRFENFKENHKKNKENYKITPPSSPESKQCYEPVSPRSQKFKEYTDFGNLLNFNQSLNKCPRCKRPSIVEFSIGICQNRNCGYIYCQKCDSFAFQYGDFIDRCRGITFAQSLDKQRKWLEDMSNNSPDCTVGSILNSTTDYLSSNMQYSSGYISGYDTSHTASVKRNLSKSFGGNGSISRPQRALFDSNRSTRDNESFTKTHNCDDRRKSSIKIIPVIQNDKKRIEVKEPSSPPPKIYSACSKQSKKMLKRLTR
ncbi:uncharacterized protein LOC143193996 [Rhynchophorus ferrugineus]